MKEPARVIEVFYSYAHEDEELRQRLQTHLGVLKYQELITDWHDRDIRAGEEWARQLQVHLDTADIILLLISPDFLNSAYINSVEMKRALERHNAGEARVIPIILVPVYWQDTPFSKLQILPKDGQPVKSGRWNNLDEAFAHIAEGISKVIKELPAKTKEQWRKDAIAYLGAGMYEKAFAACEKAVQLDSTYAQIHRTKGDILYKRGRYKDALKAYEHAIKLNPKYAGPHEGRGKVLYHYGDYDKALIAYQRAIEIDSTYAAAIRGRDKMLQKLGIETDKPSK
ncbi:MAG TPA: tetratricopeptide repeat protein [Ktedonobacteraceae bacterium]|jgi:tetratricopeptide (TPR) repeat protein